MSAPPTFRDVTRAEAERMLVAACIDYEHALLAVLQHTQPEPFRSDDREYLAYVFYVLAGWYDRGAYDQDTNRERLEQAGLLYYDDLCAPWCAVVDIADALADALAQANDADDAYVAVHEARLTNYPLAHDVGVEDAIYARLRDALMARRQQRLASQSTGARPPAGQAPAAPYKRRGGFMGGVKI